MRNVDFRMSMVIFDVAHKFRRRRFPQMSCRIERTCFFNLITLNLSKSVKFRLLSACSFFLEYEDSAHLASISFLAHNFLTGPVPAARGSLGMVKGVRVTWERAATWRGTTLPSWEEGPSTRTYLRWRVFVRRGSL